MTPQTGNPLEQVDGAARQFISITIGDDEYGVDIIAIREIRGWTTTTALPDSPAWMRGVIDLRGSVVPVLDLRTRFSGAITQAGPRHVIVVVQVDGRDVGILVDAVADILTVPAGAIQPVPELEHAHARGHDVLTGIVPVEGRMVALLDLENLLETDGAASAASAH